jgi:hypothetical protein
MKLSKGYPVAKERVQTAGHELRKSQARTDLAKFEVEYLIDQKVVFTELYYRHANRRS